MIIECLRPNIRDVLSSPFCAGKQNPSEQDPQAGTEYLPHPQGIATHRILADLHSGISNAGRTCLMLIESYTSHDCNLAGTSLVVHVAD